MRSCSESRLESCCGSFVVTLRGVNSRAVTAPKEARNLYIDAHNHLLMSHAAWDGESPRVLPCDAIRARLETGRAGAVGLVVGGRRAFPHRAPESSWWGTLDALSQFWRGQSEAHRPLRILRTTEDVDRLSSELPSVLLSIEGAAPCFDTPLGDPIAALNILYQLGVRSIQPLGALPSPAFDAEGKDRASSPRLSSSGRKLIAEASRLGLVIDTAHLTGEEPAFAEILESASAPPIASHHSCRSLNGLPRALSDRAIRDIARVGGVVGIHSGSAYLTGSERHAAMTDLIAHIRHVAELVGADHVAIGTDYIDIARIPMDLPASTFMKGVGESGFMSQLADALNEEGFDDAERTRILSGNVRRLWHAALRSTNIVGTAAQC